MHRRKEYLIYPAGYTPGRDKYLVRYSRRQAWKAAVKLGAGTCVDVSIQIHPSKHRFWTSAFGEELWDVVWDVVLVSQQSPPQTLKETT